LTPRPRGSPSPSSRQTSPSTLCSGGAPRSGTWRTWRRSLLRIRRARSPRPPSTSRAGSSRG